MEKREINLPESERLKFREMSEKDLDFVHSMLSSPIVMKYYPKVFTADDSRQWILRQNLRYDAYGTGLWIASDKKTEKPVGQMGLVFQTLSFGTELEIAYLLSPEYFKTGYAAEAAKCLKEFAFQKMGRKFVISIIRPENKESRKVAERNGMSVWMEERFHGFSHLVYRADPVLK
ncbi:MAG TPA: GNAT family N-acetyltransferase [Leptospiraceae bacterium]|nr:GNAT family N-acetyltransferase [Leptospiraceae bacterium]HMY67808.1 GNAT family N-acetyltransferase [Leptospiraceae bacterium]HMZ59879.1 GNAT family N-acetyltransferase [Leptospiraceae bacterium]HNF13332.1 GNAT family N-acetyltransferase [Leptospiraceae bacterium]HNF27007.1 GNAT family N-acetyltransferase [Leptospiraceae bacterium]